MAGWVSVPNPMALLSVSYTHLDVYKRQGAYAKNPTLLPTGEMEHFNEPVKTLRRIFNPNEGGHEQDWIRACKEPKATRLEASSNFSYSGPLSEVVALGALAVKLQSLQRKLLWDGDNMRFTNIGMNDVLRILTKSQFEGFGSTTYKKS